MKELRMNLGERSYSINIGRGLLPRCDKYFDLDRKVFILTDSGVPEIYAKTVAGRCKDPIIYTVPEGEGSKSLETYGHLLSDMIKAGMTRTDCVVAVGGGVIGDLGGFLAASYMRGIDFYNIPTTVLSQVDSSIGGKTAINHGGVKNTVGAFHQPKGVICDLDTLTTLPKRQVSNGLAEAVKMALTFDAELFGIFEESDDLKDRIEEIITKSLMIKKTVVEADERESGLRKVLNFGHTFGHAVEAIEEMCGLYHGECVAIGMTATASDDVKKRLIPVLKKLDLPYTYEGDVEAALAFINHDKKCDGKKISVIFVDKIGSFCEEKIEIKEFFDIVREAFGK